MNERKMFKCNPFQTKEGEVLQMLACALSVCTRSQTEEEEAL